MKNGLVQQSDIGLKKGKSTPVFRRTFAFVTTVKYWNVGAQHAAPLQTLLHNC